MSEKQTIQFVVPANLHNSSFVRRVSEEMFKKVKFAKEWCSRLKLVVDELFMNAVKYGSTVDKSSIYITFSYDENEVLFVIEDDGTGSQSIPAEELQKKIQQNEQNTDLTRTSGRGLSMITKKWTDGMEVVKSEKGGLKITFTKKIEPIDSPIVNPVEKPVEEAPVQLATPLLAPVPTAPAPTTREIPANCPVQDFKLSGEIDQSNITEKVAPVFEMIKATPAGCGLVLDFSELEYINSTFIGNLAAWYTSMRDKGGFVRLTNVNKEIKEVLDLVGLSDVIEIT